MVKYYVDPKSGTIGRGVRPEVFVGMGWKELGAFPDMDDLDTRFMKEVKGKVVVDAARKAEIEARLAEVEKLGG